MECYGNLSCTVVIETIDPYGRVTKRRNINDAFLMLGRDEFKDIKLKINGEPYTLRDFKIFHKFLKDAKASLIFSKISTNILLSNAPPDKLSAFLKIMKIKTAIQKQIVTDRMKLYSKSAKTFEEISPLTVNDVKKFNGEAILKSPVQTMPIKRKSSDITPVRVTSHGLECVNGGARKRLNSAPLSLIKLGENNIKSTNKMNSTSTKSSKTITSTCASKTSTASKFESETVNKKVNLLGKLTSEQNRSAHSQQLLRQPHPQVV